MMTPQRFAHVLFAALLVACTGPETDSDSETNTDSDSDTDTDTDVELPVAYAFGGRDGSSSSVAYDGQVMRQLLINDLKVHTGALTARLNSGFFPVAGEVTEELEFYFAFDSATSGTVLHTFTTTPTTQQSTYDTVSTGKNLVGKIAGNDAAGQHEDWSTAFVGWPHDDVTTPESLVRLWFGELDAASVAWSNGTIATDPSGTPVPAVYVTADGRDLQQLTQKFLLGAVAFSQGTDDYLDDDLAGSGLLASNIAEADAAYTPLEHAWDEAFGYFGAARGYPSLTDDQIASPGYADSFVVDGAIDLQSEVCWGHSTNAAKRDLGAVTPTDYTADAWEGFAAGRALIASVDGELSPAQRVELQGYRDQAVTAWEAAIAATVVHYINQVVREMDDFGTDDYDFAAHAKAWSELKGFALSFQFNPRSPLADEDFETLHQLLGVHPALPGTEDDVANYRDDLLEARTLIGTAYGFDAANLGDADGNGGW